MSNIHKYYYLLFFLWYISWISYEVSYKTKYTEIDLKIVIVQKSTARGTEERHFHSLYV